MSARPQTSKRRRRCQRTLARETPLRQRLPVGSQRWRCGLPRRLFLHGLPAAHPAGHFRRSAQERLRRSAGYSRNVVRLAGARVEVRRSPGFDPQRTCFFVSNHVNLFDPFVLYSAIPQFFRGLELESHFRIPVYGWLMKRFGNVPVPDVRALRPETHVADDASGAG